MKYRFESPPKGDRENFIIKAYGGGRGGIGVISPKNGTKTGWRAAGRKTKVKAGSEFAMPKYQSQDRTRGTVIGSKMASRKHHQPYRVVYDNQDEESREEQLQQQKQQQQH